MAEETLTATGAGTALERGIEFLARRQLPSGTFRLHVGYDLTSGETAAEDHNVFSAAVIGHSLLACGAAARPVVDRAVGHLRRHVESGGVWRYFTEGDAKYRWVPPDLDDTSCASALLRAVGEPVPDNRAVVLANRDPRGLFHTWIVPRRPVPRSPAWWRVAIRRARHPREARKVWALTHARPSDVDGIVNANVLAYLGDGGDAAPVVARLVDVFRRGEEHRCDKWYRGQFAFNYAVARAAGAGIAGLDAIRDEACERLLAAAQSDGRIGDGPLDTALAVCGLDRWGAGEQQRMRACAYLEAVQAPDGSWPRAAYYYGGARIDPPVVAYGAEELTTGFCAEALARCRRT